MKKSKIMVKFSRGTLTPDQFMEDVGASKHEFLGNVVDRYNDTVTKEEDKAEIVLVK